MYPFALLNNPPAPTYPEYAQLYDEARRTTPRFVDPANLYPAAGVGRRRGADWCTAVLGFPFPGQDRLTGVQTQLLIVADQADINPPLPGWIVAGRAEGQWRQAERDRERREQAQREAGVWNEVLANTAVDLGVREGSRPRARHGTPEPLRHAVPTSNVYSGTRTIRTHAAGRALCETPDRARPLALGETTSEPATCVRCLQWAPKVRAAAEQPVTTSTMNGEHDAGDAGADQPAHDARKWWAVGSDYWTAPWVYEAPSARAAVAAHRRDLIDAEVYNGRSRREATDWVRVLNLHVVDGPMTTAEAHDYDLGWCLAKAVCDYGPDRALSPVPVGRATEEEARRYFVPEDKIRGIKEMIAQRYGKAATNG